MKTTHKILIELSIYIGIVGLLYVFDNRNIPALEKKANEGNVEANLELGSRYYEGQGIKKTIKRLSIGIKKVLNKKMR